MKRYAEEGPAELEKIYQEKLAGLRTPIEKNHPAQQQFIKELIADRKLNFSQVIKRFSEQWEIFLAEHYEKGDKTLSKTQLANNPELHYQFIQNLLPPKELTLREAVQHYPADWELFLTQVATENNIPREKVKDHDLYQNIYHAMIKHKTSLSFAEVIKGHELEWNSCVDRLHEEKKKTVNKERIINDPFNHNRILTRLVDETIPDFFNANNQANINKYSEHLKANFRWGSEESLLSLHNYVQGQVKTRTTDGRLVIDYQHDISMQIYRNGVPTSNKFAKPDMVLNNLHNVHWVSLVEPVTRKAQADHQLQEEEAPIVNALVSSDLSQVTELSVENLDELDTAPIINTEVESTPRVLIEPLISQNQPRLSEEPLARINSPSEGRLSHLTFCGFNIYLRELKATAQRFANSSPEASKEAFALYKRLVNEKKQFIAPDSTLNTKDFAEHCQQIIKESPKSHLAQHRGVGLILNGLLNALILLGNLFIGTANLILGRYELIDPDRIQTSSINNITALNMSLTALKAIRAREGLQTLAAPKESEDLTDSSELPLRPGLN